METENLNFHGGKKKEKYCIYKFMSALWSVHSCVLVKNTPWMNDIHWGR